VLNISIRKVLSSKATVDPGLHHFGLERLRKAVIGTPLHPLRYRFHNIVRSHHEQELGED
jgi:hypothetical protein